MKFKLLMAAISFIPAMVMAQAPVLAPPVINSAQSQSIITPSKSGSTTAEKISDKEIGNAVKEMQSKNTELARKQETKRPQ